MADETELRMNLAAIKRVDPYARAIVDSSAHVAFYTFNATETEWEKTDVEGAFFIYNRTAEPLHSIFINNRLNTNSLVEPIAGQLELQSQPPFLLYRNERNRIRGFWFYNKDECDRIGTLVDRLIRQAGAGGPALAGPARPPSAQLAASNAAVAVHNGAPNAAPAPATQPAVANPALVTQLSHGSNPMGNVDIFSLLSKAQENYNNAQNGSSVAARPPNKPAVAPTTTVAGPSAPKTASDDVPSQSVRNFFASAVPATAKEVPMFQHMLSQPMSVDQLEKQHQQLQHKPQQTHENASGKQQQLFFQRQDSKPEQNGLVDMLRNASPAVQSQQQRFMRIVSPVPAQQAPARTATVDASTGSASPLATFISNNSAAVRSATKQQPGIPANAITADLADLEMRQQQAQQQQQPQQQPQSQQPLQQLLRRSDSKPAGAAAAPALNGLANVASTPGKPTLLLPTMFTPTTAGDMGASTPSVFAAGGGDHGEIDQLRLQLQQNMQLSNVAPPPLHLNASLGPAKPEPLTQSQLLQAMNYMMRNDPDFVRKLHEAYLKSFTEMVSF